MRPTFDVPPLKDPESFTNNEKFQNKVSLPADSAYKLQIFQSSLNLLAHILIGSTVGVVIVFAFRASIPLSATNLHLFLCVIGYHLLMAQAILSLSGENGWSSRLKLVHKRRAHWILQIMGSGMAIAGSAIKIIDADVHWNTLHGKFALTALGFTCVSLVNGLASLYFYELRRLFNGNLMKITHICFGTVAFTMASCCLCYGFEKNSFRNWATDPLAYTAIAFVATYTFIIIINPLITFYQKSMLAIKTART